VTNAKGEEQTAALRKRCARQLKRKMTEISVKGVYDEHARGCFASYTGWLGWCDGQGLYDKYMRPLEKVSGVK
jgi:hypothetical protein